MFLYRSYKINILYGLITLMEGNGRAALSCSWRGAEWVCGIKDLKNVYLYEVRKSDELRKTYLEQVHKLGKELG